MNYKLFLGFSGFYLASYSARCYFFRSRFRGSIEVIRTNEPNANSDEFDELIKELVENANLNCFLCGYFGN